MTWHSHNTKFTACSVESCDHPALGSLVALGTYQLNQDTGLREGQVELGLVRAGDNVTYESQNILDTGSGVLDMKWSNHEDNPLLATAQSNGKVCVYEVTIGDHSEKCSLKQILEVEVTTGLCLALEWSRDNERLVVTDSLGHVTLLSVTRDNCSTLANIKGHGFEAWTACFPCEGSTEVFYSGGDDAKLSCYDLRASEASAVRSNSRSHSSGVTSMVSIRDEVTLLTGSYDEHVRLWDTRSLKTEMDTWHVGGGVWRLRPGDGDKLLVAAMHDGFKVLDIKDGGRILQENKGHDSLAYGADWVTPTDSHYVVAACSFYDRLFTVWGFPR